jgi:serine O-acetyltransferase
MTYREFTRNVRSDLYRYEGKTGIRIGIKRYLLTPGFKISFWHRLCRYLMVHPLFRRGVFHCGSYLMLHYSHKYGIQIPHEAQIGPGLYMPHYGGIFINANVTIGKSCNISHNVTLGQANRGPRQGCPVIGDNVYIGPGAVIIGAVNVGNCAAIGANCVVTHDVPENAVVVGVPGRVISYGGSAGYVNRTEDAYTLKDLPGKASS